MAEDDEQRQLLPRHASVNENPDTPKTEMQIPIKYMKICIATLIYILYHVYMGFAIYYDWSRTLDWCNGSRLLVILTVMTYITVGYYNFLKPACLQSDNFRIKWQAINNCLTQWRSTNPVKWCIRITMLSLVVIFYIVDCWNKWYRLIPLLGIFSLILLGYIFSNNRKMVVWRQITWGLGIQFCMGLITIRWPFGREFFKCISDKVVTFLSYGNAGSAFVFDYLATGNMTIFNSTSHDPIKNIIIETIFAFQVLPVILFFSFFISILYYYGIMQRIIILLGWLLYISIGTTAAESMNAAASVFLGMTEAPLMIRPYMVDMTKSELHTVMAGGFATIAGTVFAAYISFGINAIYLLSGAIMSAPAALAYSKLLYPETETSRTRSEDIRIEKGEERNVLEAASNGAMAAISLVAGIATGLVVFISFITFLDGILVWFGSMINWEFLTLEWLLGKIFTPLAFLMGVKWSECSSVGTLIGIKTIINEFVAYKQLSKMTWLSARSTAIATYALCSFSNLPSLGMQIGVLGAIVPTRRADLAEVGFRALCAGAAACFLTACLAGSLLD